MRNTKTCVKSRAIAMQRCSLLTAEEISRLNSPLDEDLLHVAYHSQTNTYQYAASWMYDAADAPFKFQRGDLQSR
jgi:hypothetical protein